MRHWSNYEIQKVDNISKEEEIQHRKSFNKLYKNAEKKSKLKNCFYCNAETNSFCNSHTIPVFCLKNISVNGQLLYNNSILELPEINKIKGLKEAGTFRLICKHCDSKIFQEYENPDNYYKKPNVKMLAEIEIKNTLKKISKRMIEKNSGVPIFNSDILNMDLEEYTSGFYKAKKRSNKPMIGDYHIGFYKELNYTVPIAYQGTISMVYDLDKNIINNIYDYNPNNKMKYLNVCVFPMENRSIIIIFIDKKNKKYQRFLKQLNKIKDQDIQLQIITDLILRYDEDFFLSPNISQEVRDKLYKSVSITTISKTCENIHDIKKDSTPDLSCLENCYNLNKDIGTPNLLSKKFSI